MNKYKRKEILKILKSGHSAVNIAYSISLYLDQPEEDILRIIQAHNWNIKFIMVSFENFKESKNNYIYYKTGIESIKEVE